MNNVGRFKTEVVKTPGLNCVILDNSHPRRIETGLQAIVNSKETGNVHVMFQPIKRSKFSDVDRILVSGQYKDIKKMFQEINQLLERVGGNKAAAVIEYLQGNKGVSFNSNEILTSLSRIVTSIKK